MRPDQTHVYISVIDTTTRLILIVLLAVFAAAQSVVFAQEKSADPKKGTMATASKDEMIAKIATIKQKWEKMDAYYDGTKLVRIQLYPRKGSERTEEFYLMDNKLVFAFIQDKGPKHEGKDAGEPGKELYFHNDKVIKFEDRSGEKAANAEQEKKMYEARLPYEIADLLEILKKK